MMPANPKQPGVRLWMNAEDHGELGALAELEGRSKIDELRWLMKLRRAQIKVVRPPPPTNNQSSTLSVAQPGASGG